MRPKLTRISLALICLPALLGVARLSVKAADTLPGQYTDAEFWRMVTDFSEAGGDYQFENFVSNEISYQEVLPELSRLVKPGGVYLGVASEQNFTYIDVVRPKVAFIFDVRRQNTLQLLMYKALFEIADNRADFVSLLFSRKRPAGLDANSSVDALFQAFAEAKPDPQLYAATLKDIKDRLIRQHRFALSADDERKIEYIFNVFFRGGPRMDYGFASTAPNPYVPSYHALAVANDGRGKNWVYLNREESYKVVRAMQQKNLIVPLVGDFTGGKAIKAVSQYVKDHGSTISVFYISNVEDYIQAKWSAYLSNLAALPADNSTLLIRFEPYNFTTLGKIQDVPPTWPGQYFH
ncbi:MAG TPA: hypothetical protein VMB70_05810 [Terriglobia bacterium]|nr:hypothetical protein [Terriglobia bacterium]